MLGSDIQDRGDFSSCQPPSDLLPPECQKVAVVIIEPASGLGDLLALSGQPQLQDRKVHKVAHGIGDLC
ncbi:hypothetical protein AMK12_37410 [Streptomyces sp. TSRI0395]|nr:hypothetical protein AMK12_37410 [Streptomyces sp. TSRI0395]